MWFCVPDLNGTYKYCRRLFAQTSFFVLMYNFVQTAVAQLVAKWSLNWLLKMSGFSCAFQVHTIHYAQSKYWLRAHFQYNVSVQTLLVNVRYGSQRTFTKVLTLKLVYLKLKQQKYQYERREMKFYQISKLHKFS